MAYIPLKLKVSIAMKVTIQARDNIMGKFMLFASTSIKLLLVVRSNRYSMLVECLISKLELSARNFVFVLILD